MSVISGCPTGLYSPAHDRAVSPAGTQIRESIQTALAHPRAPRTAQMLERISQALRKGTDVTGILVGVEAFRRMMDVVSLLPPDVPLPNVVIESESQIGLDWDAGSRRVLTLTVNETSYLGFAALLGREPIYGRVPFAGEIPETVAYLLTRLYSPGAATAASS